MTPDDLKDIPDGALVRLTVEGRVRRQGKEILLAHRVSGEHEYAVQAAWSDGATASWVDAVTAVEVLPEPVVEPTGRLAMVTDNEGAPWVCSGESLNTGIALWRSASIGGSKAITWAVLKRELGPLRVVFEGVDE